MQIRVMMEPWGSMWAMVSPALRLGGWCSVQCTLVSGALETRPLPQFAFVASILMQLPMLVACVPGVAHLEGAKPLDRGKARCPNEVQQTSCLFVARHEHLAAHFDVGRSHGCGGICVSL